MNKQIRLKSWFSLWLMITAALGIIFSLKPDFLPGTDTVQYYGYFLICMVILLFLGIIVTGESDFFEMLSEKPIAIKDENTCRKKALHMTLYSIAGLILYFLYFKIPLHMLNRSPIRNSIAAGAVLCGIFCCCRWEILIDSKNE